MSTESAVSDFNSLPRNPLAPSGLVANHWHFSIRHIPTNPPGDIVLFINPESLYMHTEGPTQLAFWPVAHQAAIIAPLLVQGFNAGLSIPDGLRYAPWDWATNNPALAREVAKALKELGVRDELCTVAVADDEENALSDQYWFMMVATICRELALGYDG